MLVANANSIGTVQNKAVHTEISLTIYVMVVVQPFFYSKAEKKHSDIQENTIHN